MALALAPAELLSAGLELAGAISRGSFALGGLVGGVREASGLVGGGTVERRQRRRCLLMLLHELGVGSLRDDRGVLLHALGERLRSPRSERAAEPVDRIG